MAEDSAGMSRMARKCADISRILIKEETREHVKKVSLILKKAETERTEAERTLLHLSPGIVDDIVRRGRSRQVAKERQLEVEDSADVLKEKCVVLAAAISESRHLVVYTGAGISTAASIPDYRGPNGIWTRLLQGRPAGPLDMTAAVPTYTHMSLLKLHTRGILKHVVSQNCDGLHLRSGLPRHALSEVHGNMYIELCGSCASPANEYVRLFDVTERTAVRRHNTGRRCCRCDTMLRDSIVHFGERGRLNAPYNWHQAAAASGDADLVLCLGSSLKVLRRYPCLWAMHLPVADRPKLFIVNLQWTPKDDVATMKINGKCDEVMRLVMENIELPVDPYSWESDPIFATATSLTLDERQTTSRRMLVAPSGDQTAPDERTDSKRRPSGEDATGGGSDGEEGGRRAGKTCRLENDTRAGIEQRGGHRKDTVDDVDRAEHSPDGATGQSACRRPDGSAPIPTSVVGSKERDISGSARSDVNGSEADDFAGVVSSGEQRRDGSATKDDTRGTCSRCKASTRSDIPGSVGTVSSSEVDENEDVSAGQEEEAAGARNCRDEAQSTGIETALVTCSCGGGATVANAAGRGGGGEPASADDVDDAQTPGWFGKGLNRRRKLKRKKSK